MLTALVLQSQNKIFESTFVIELNIFSLHLHQVFDPGLAYSPDKIQKNPLRQIKLALFEENWIIQEKININH